MGGAIECPLCGNNQAYCKCTRLERAQFLEIARLREELRWIPVTEQLPPHDTYVDFLGAYGGGHGSRGLSKEDCEKYSLTYDPIPKIYENETGPYLIGKDQQGYWGVTHWRLRPGTQPDFDKFIKENI